jgi:RHS repeat-associated protein
LRTLRGAESLQDLSYTYDAAGNVTHIRDQADIHNVIYFSNKRVEPSTDYSYDAIYRLIRATGREHLGQTSGQLNQPTPPDPNNAFHMKLPHPGDGNAVGTYVEEYIYDQVGNILELRHRGSDPANPGWRRSYVYEELSTIEGGKKSNRLSETVLGNGVSQPAENYAHDAHGNMASMPHLSLMQWGYRDQLFATARQVVNGGTPETTWYVYDAAGQRMRKVTERKNGGRKEERIYLGSFEIYREYTGNGDDLKLERETLNVMDDKERVALIETRTLGDDGSSPQLTRYQFNNHLQSASLELDGDAQIISYEEFYPYGGTSYQAVRSQTETAKRYRYISRERDEETGLYYHGARYYSPWLGRWTAADPIGIGDGVNLYAFVKGNPVRLVDPDGTSGLTLELGESQGSFEQDADLMSAGYETVKSIHEDLYNYFGISTDMGHKTTTKTTFDCGGGPGAAPASRYTKVTLEVSTDQDRQNKALEALRNRLTEVEKRDGGSDAEIKARVDARMTKIEKARQFLIDSFAQGFTLNARTMVDQTALIGAYTTGSSDVRTGDMHINPYTFFTWNDVSNRWESAISASSGAAKAALSPALQLLHELVHYRKKYVHGGDTSKMFDIYANEEERTIEDVDKAVAGLSGIVALREWYGKGKTVDAQGHSVEVNQGEPDQTYVLGANGINYKVTYQTLAGKEWVKWPSSTQLTKGGIK